jgi:hypothetical protein
MADYLWHAAGRFQFAELLCLLSSEYGPPPTRREASMEEIATTMLRVSAADSERSGTDHFAIEQLPDDMSDETSSSIFHERIHYWQYISSPLLQQQFLTELDRIALNVAAAGGNWRQLMISVNAISDPASVIRTHEIYRAQNTVFDMGAAARIAGADQVSYDLPTLQVFYLRPLPPNAVTPGYGAVMELPDGEAAHVPFTTVALAESAAYVTECLRAGRTPGRLTDTTAAQRRYLGCWEYWCRLRSSATTDEGVLAANFLAAVDLALVGGTVEPEDEGDEEFRQEQLCIPYRFGKLAFRSQGFRLLPADPASAQIEEWQADFCRYQGWPAPRESFANSVVELTRRLIMAYGNLLIEDGHPQSYFTRFLQLPAEAAAADPRGAYQEIWSAIQSATVRPRGARPVGTEAIGVMLNASMYRLDHPGRFAAPHLFGPALTAVFPLPLLLLHGRYYADHETYADAEETLRQQPAMPYWPESSNVTRDCMQLIPLAPLADGKSGCGFFDEQTGKARCSYGQFGFGCPHAGLTDDQTRLRAGHGMGDWCHKKYIHRRLRLSFPT